MAGIVQTILGFMQQQEANRLAREEWDIKKEEATTKMKQQKMILDPIEKAITAGIITKDQASSILLDPKGISATLWSLSQWNEPTKEQQPKPLSFEQTGQSLRATEPMISQEQKSLPQTIARGIFGGMNQQDAMKDVLYKETGIGRSQEPVGSPRDIENPITGQKQMGVVLKGGGFKWLTDPQGNPLVVPPDVEWKKTVIGNQVVEIGYSKKGELIQQNGMPLIRANIPQEQQMLKGIAGPGGSPTTIPVPPGGIPPQGLPEAVKGEPLTMTGPKGEIDTLYINPYTLHPITEQPGASTKQQGLPGGVPTPGIRTKPPQGLPGETANKINQVKTGIAALQKMRDLLFDKSTGEINRSALATGKLSIPWTEGKQLKDTLFAAIDPIQRAASGAVIRPEEEAMYRRTYGADYTMNDQQIYDNWDRLSKHLMSQAELMDPNAIWTPALKKQFEEAIKVPMRFKGTTKKYEKLSDEEFLRARPK